MKTLTRISALLLTFVMLISLCACSDTKEPQQEEKPAEDGLITSFDIPDYPASYPTHDDIVAAYKAAADAVGWFNIVSAPPVVPDSEVNIDGLFYSKVNSEKVVDFATLRAYLETLMDYDLADLLMDCNTEIKRFVEHEGALYCTTFVFKPQWYTEKEEFRTEKVSDTEYTIYIDYQYIDNDGVIEDKTQKHTFEKVDGRWIFTGFYLYRL